MYLKNDMRTRKEIIAKVVKNTGAKTLQSIIVKHVAAKSAIFTDENASYKGLKKLGYKHHAVNHSKGEYVDGNTTTNGIESFWALFKRGLTGTYHSVSKKHLQKYVDEFGFKASKGTIPFIEAVCEGANGKAMKYAKLTGGKPVVLRVSSVLSPLSMKYTVATH